jgi:catechol 2,3-dioxygenase-like lactoylglutathione lyase family enzyme|nr:VOC family protein [uncultured Pedobacter sp.]
MIPFKKIDHILINVPIGKLAEAGDFYQNVLKLPIILGDRPFNALWFKLADIELHIMEEQAGNISQRHPAFEVSDLKSAKEFLESKNIEISYSTKIEGRERLFFRDPFGNRFELIEFL